MDVALGLDIDQFAALAEPCLGGAAEAPNNLLWNVWTEIRVGRPPGRLPPRFAVVTDDGPVGAMIHTPPHNAILSTMSEPAACALADRLRGTSQVISGITGPPEVAAAFVQRWCDGQRVQAATGLELVVMATTDRPPPSTVQGAGRIATSSDRRLLEMWVRGFWGEVNVTPDGPVSQVVGWRLEEEGWTLWEVDGEPVSMVARDRASPSYDAITYVYTPPLHRKRGYGGAVTGMAVNAACDGGRGAALLADRDNPTSQGVYRRLGFANVGALIAVSFQR